MDTIIHKYDKKGMIGGEGSMTRDLITTTNTDFAMVNVLSVIMIFIIVALTFKSFALPVILVLTIEFAITINMGMELHFHLSQVWLSELFNWELPLTTLS